MAGSGYDDNVCWTIELAGMSLGAHNGAPGIHLPTARQNILVRLRWNRVKTTNAVTKADVKLEQIGHGYDKIDYEGSETSDAEHGKSIRWFQHTITFEIAFHTVASPIGINLGQTLKLDGLEKINSSFAGTISGWYDIVTGTSGLEVYFL